MARRDLRWHDEIYEHPSTNFPIPESSVPASTSYQSNEITAIPELLRLLDLKGAIVSIDAMGCQKNIARVIRERGAHYLFGLKGNQPALHREVLDAFDTCTCSQLQQTPNCYGSSP